MKHPLSELELKEISAAIVAQTGLHFPPANWRNLENILQTAAKGLGFTDVRECIAQFTSPSPSEELVASLAPYLTTGETYFFREIKCFEILEKKILPEIIEKRRGKNQRLRIWSAGCATGEEAYSIAILLDKMLDALQGWEISILATDINPLALDKARAGIYTNWSFRKTPTDFRANYFRETEDGRFALLPEIKKMVTFSSLNLVTDAYRPLAIVSHDIDVIFCRNVLMYFPPLVAGRVVERFHHCLEEDGTLFVGACETSNTFFTDFDPIKFPGATYYQKRLNWGAAKPGGMGLESLAVSSSPIAPETATSLAAPPSGRNEETTYQEALTYFARGNYKQAAEWVFSQRTKDENDIRALTLLCRIYANEGSLSEALTISDQALAIDKYSAELHYLRAIILQELGLDNEAVVPLKKALHLKDDLIMAHFTLANLKKRTGKIRASRIHFDNALSHIDKCCPDEIIPESDGMLAGRLKEIILVTTAQMQYTRDAEG